MEKEENGSNVEEGSQATGETDTSGADESQAAEENKVENESAEQGDGDASAAETVEVPYYTTDAVCEFLKNVDTEGLFWYITDMVRTPVNVILKSEDGEEEKVQYYLNSLKLNIVPGSNVKLGWESNGDAIVPIPERVGVIVESAPAPNEA